MTCHMDRRPEANDPPRCRNGPQHQGRKGEAVGPWLRGTPPVETWGVPVWPAPNWKIGQVSIMGDELVAGNRLGFGRHHRPHDVVAPDVIGAIGEARLRGLRVPPMTGRTVTALEK